jgi:uncharacterized protein YbaP (TraB family)
MSKVLIKSLRDGYRRAGLAFNKSGTIVETDDLTEEQIEAIQNDPNLKASRPDDESDEVLRAERAAADAEVAASKVGQGKSALAESKTQKAASKSASKK